MREYLEAQIKEKLKEGKRLSKITGICFFGSLAIWVIFFIVVFSFPHLKERLLDFLRPKSFSEILSLSAIPIITIAVASIVPLLQNVRTAAEAHKLRKQLKKYEAPQG